MPPPNILGMRDPQPLGKQKPFNPWKAVSQDFYNKLEEEKLKSPAPLPLSPLPFSKTPEFKYYVKHQDVFDKINNRLAAFQPAISLDEHIVHSWDKVKELGNYLPVTAARNTLDGIDFIVEDREKLLFAVRQAMQDGKPAFVEGSSHDWKKHWALTVSFLATEGIGFREIFRPKIIDRPIQDNKSVRFDSRLGTDVNVDVSAMHIAISYFPKLMQTRCNIHIDNLTVTLAGMGDDVRISPTVITHFVNELLFKTKLKGKLPDWIIDAFDISLLNPNEGFLSAGIGATIINKPNFKWTIKYSAGLNSNTHPEWSGNFKFEHSFGTSIVVRF
jgi:hypothetical protein